MNLSHELWEMCNYAYSLNCYLKQTIDTIDARGENHPLVNECMTEIMYNFSCLQSSMEKLKQLEEKKQ